MGENFQEGTGLRAARTRDRLLGQNIVNTRDTARVFGAIARTLRTSDTWSLGGKATERSDEGKTLDPRGECGCRRAVPEDEVPGPAP